MRILCNYGVLKEDNQSIADAAVLAAENVIAFDQVDFAYHEEVPVLQGLTFSVKKGENIAFVGESGGGKETGRFKFFRQTDSTYGNTDRMQLLFVFYQGYFYTGAA